MGRVSERAALRRRVGITQRKLARLIGVDATAMCFWENHEVEFSTERIQKIAKVLAEQLSRLPATPTTAEGIAQVLVNASN